MRLRIVFVIAATLALPALTAGPALAVGEPLNRTIPELSLNGGTLTTSDGTWVGVTKPFAYAWFRCPSTDLVSCVEVPGRTANTYTLGPADGGMRLYSQVTASNSIGSSEASSEPTAVVARTPVSPGAQPAARITPFPVVVITGRQRGRLTRITGLVVRGPKGAKVSLTCRGKRCPVRRTSGTIGAKRRLRLKRAQHVYRVGQVIEIRTTQANRIGKFTRIRFRKGRTPSRSDSCLLPGAKRPSTCLTT
jgi:hypothetical protein